jgi:hypothetical protein
LEIASLEIGDAAPENVGVTIRRHLRRRVSGRIRSVNAIPDKTIFDPFGPTGFDQAA